MNEKNFEYLSKQLQYTGFGDTLVPKLKAAMEKGEAQFTLPHIPDFAKNNTAVTLQFKKSETQDNYFFNRYSVHVTTPQYPDAIKQTFYVHSNQDNITLKEAYNLLQGRAVHKEMTPKEGDPYKAWLQIDFKNAEPNGNYKFKQFHENYGYDMAAALGKHPIVELRTEEGKTRLFESLERGNRQQVTFEKEGVSQKAFVEAAPQFKSLNFSTEKGQRVTIELIHAALQPEKKPELKADQKAPQQDAGAEDDTVPKQKKGKRKGVSM